MSNEKINQIEAFCALPDTPEKLEIIRQYNADEICSLDFYSDAVEYTNKQAKAT